MKRSAADNLYTGRLILGKTPNEIVATADVSLEIATEYEAGKKRK